MDESEAATLVRSSARSPWGYERVEALERRFREAADTLRRCDGPRGAAGGELRADLVLEGGGVKGIGLYGAILALADAGYRFHRIAGTSAGAIVGAFIAAAENVDRPLFELRHHLDTLHLDHLAPMGQLRERLEHAGGVARALADAEVLSHRPGLHPSVRITQWLRHALESDFGVSRFADLSMDDPGTSQPEHHRYRLVVHVADVSRGRLARLPWDYHYYGLDRDRQDVAEAVRASMSIPLFFEPVEVRAQPTTVELRDTDGTSFHQHFEGGTVTWVDGGLIQNFPVHAFDRTDGRPPRWPTIGIRLSRRAESMGATSACRNAVELAVHCLHTVLNEWDRYGVDQMMAGRTIYVDSEGVSVTQFDVTEAQRERLFLNGVRAGTRFVIDAARAGGLLDGEVTGDAVAPERSGGSGA